MSMEEKMFAHEDGGLTKAAGTCIVNVYLKILDLCPKYNIKFES